MHEIRKYPNRRLYDLTDSKYVTADDVRKTIVSGESITVIDSRDDTDITRTVLMQILSEQESSGKASLLTNRVIEQLIRLYGDAFGPVASRFIEHSMLKFLEQQEQYQGQLRKLQDNNPFNPLRQFFDRDRPGGKD